MTDIAAQLAAPFDERDLKFFPIATSKDRKQGKVGSYADARTYMDRLDAVLGIHGWGTKYTVLDAEAKAVECRLTISTDDGATTRCDVGYPNEARDADDAGREPLKAAYSDALKRACVQFGVGRFLYSLELVKDWLPLNEWGQFTERPQLKRAVGAPAPTRTAAAPKTPPAPPAEPTACLSDEYRYTADGLAVCDKCNKPLEGPGAVAHPNINLEPEEPVSASPGAVEDVRTPASSTGATPPAPTGEIDQLGEFRDDRGGVNLTKLLRFASDQKLTAADLAKAAPHPSGSARAVGALEWLYTHPEQTLFDLVNAARNLKESA